MKNSKKKTIPKPNSPKGGNRPKATERPFSPKAAPKSLAKGAGSLPNPFKKLAKASARLKENARAACQPIARGTFESNVIKSLSGELNPGPDFVASNGPLAEKIAELASGELAKIALTDPRPVMGVLGREVSITTLDAPEIHVDEIGRLAARTLSSISENYLAMATFTTLPPVGGPQSFQLGFQGVFWGRRSKATCRRARDARGMPEQVVTTGSQASDHRHPFRAVPGWHQSCGGLCV